MARDARDDRDCHQHHPYPEDWRCGDDDRGREGDCEDEADREHDEHYQEGDGGLCLCVHEFTPCGRGCGRTGEE